MLLIWGRGRLRVIVIGLRTRSWVCMCLVVAEVLLLLSYDFLGAIGIEWSGSLLHLDSIFECR